MQELIKEFANLDGFRVYKVKSRGDKMGDRLYIAPVYVIGLPGDVALLNKEIEEKEKESMMYEFKVNKYVDKSNRQKGVFLP